MSFKGYLDFLPFPNTCPHCHGQWFPLFHHPICRLSLLPLQRVSASPGHLAGLDPAALYEQPWPYEGSLREQNMESRSLVIIGPYEL